MPYYPLSQIQTDFFTNGDEYIFINTEELYTGPYYKTSDGKFYSGKIPNQQSRELILVNPATLKPPTNPNFGIKPSENSINIVGGPTQTDNPIFDPDGNFLPTSDNSGYIFDGNSRILPTPYYPILTQKQKNNKQFTRYFTKKTNELKYIEIDKITYDALLNKEATIAYDLYEPASLIWKIEGDRTEIFNSNKGAALSVEQQSRWPGFFQYFKDKFTQFYQTQTVQENLYTNGGEFQTPDGKEYIGPYHIHPEKGAMVGAVHVKKKHDLLFPLSPNAPQIETPPPSQPKQPSTTPPSMGGGGYSGGGGY